MYHVRQTAAVEHTRQALAKLYSRPSMRSIELPIACSILQSLIAKQRLNLSATRAVAHTRDFDFIQPSSVAAKLQPRNIKQQAIFY